MTQEVETMHKYVEGTIVQSNEDQDLRDAGESFRQKVMDLAMREGETWAMVEIPRAVHGQVAMWAMLECAAMIALGIDSVVEENYRDKYDAQVAKTGTVFDNLKAHAMDRFQDVQNELEDDI